MRHNDHIYSAGCTGRKREDFNQMNCNCFFIAPSQKRANIKRDEKKRVLVCYFNIVLYIILPLIYLHEYNIRQKMSDISQDAVNSVTVDRGL